VALARGQLDIADHVAIAALDSARAHRLPLAAVDAVELRAEVSKRRAQRVMSRSLAEGARAERERLNYRFVLTATAA
jgi:hypothetical protein